MRVLNIDLKPPSLKIEPKLNNSAKAKLKLHPALPQHNPASHAIPRTDRVLQFVCLIVASKNEQARRPVGQDIAPRPPKIMEIPQPACARKDVESCLF